MHLLKENSENTSEIYYLARRSTTVNDWYYPNTKTYDQLKSSGGFRLISQQNILDSITSYYPSVKWYETEGGLLNNILGHIYTSNEKLFNGAVFLMMTKTMKGGFDSSDFKNYGITHLYLALTQLSLIP